MFIIEEQFVIQDGGAETNIKFHLLDYGIFCDWLKHHTTLSERTRVMYEQGVARFLNEKPNLSNVEDYNNFIIKASIKKRSAYYYYALKYWINFKISNKALRDKILKDLIRPKLKDPKTEHLNLNENQRLDIINNFTREKHRVIALIQMCTGIRVGDVLRIEIGKIQKTIWNDKECLKFDITAKGEKTRVVYLFDLTIIKIITDYLKNEGYDINKNSSINISEEKKNIVKVKGISVITNNVKDENKIINKELLQWKPSKDYYFLQIPYKTKKIQTLHTMMMNNYNVYRDDLKMSLNASGLDSSKFSTHDFRRCFAVDNFRRYNNILTLQRSLGHSDINSTIRYLKFSGEDIAKTFFEMQTS